MPLLPFPLHRSALLLTFAALAAGLSSCAASQRAKSLEDHRIPTRGGDLAPEVWEDARQETRRLHEASSVRFWLLPMSLYVRQFRLDDQEGQAQGANFRWNDLASPLLLTTLPLRLHYSEHYYAEGTAEPTGRLAFWWNPLWTGSSVEHPEGSSVGRTEISAKGIPLLFSSVRATAPGREAPQTPTPTALGSDGGQLSVFTSLWTLGPAAIRVTSGETDAPDSGTGIPESNASSGYAAAPVLLGGVLGGLLWTDYLFRNRGTGTPHLDREGRFSVSEDVPEAERSAREHQARDAYLMSRPRRDFAMAHGPLLGFLGYRRESSQLYVTADQIQPTDAGVADPYGGHATTAVLGGILWRSFERRDWDGETVYSGHGPLWGFIGWGHRQDRFSPRFLWISF